MSGRGTAAGIGFQAKFGAYVAALILSGQKLSLLDTKIPGKPLKLWFETDAKVDDVYIQTDHGRIFVQAKRSLALSKDEDSELAGVATQFVAEFFDNQPDGKHPNPLNSKTDRFILAVEDDAPATVRINLRDVLEKNRTGAATAISEELTKALKIFSDHIDRAWFAIKSSGITESERNEILLLCSVVVCSDRTEAIVCQAINNAELASDTEISILNNLYAWGVDGSASGTGGDKAELRRYLSDKVSLLADRDFKPDIEALMNYSLRCESALLRFQSIKAPESVIKVQRPVARTVSETALNQSFLITGEPGAGKSSVLISAANDLKKTKQVIVLTAEANMTTLDALRSEIGLKYPLLQVIEALTEDHETIFFIDALDAVRGGLAEKVYRQLIAFLKELPNCKVVASIRSFDLVLGKEMKALFLGSQVSKEFFNSQLAGISHLHIPSLSDEELEQVIEQSPSIKSVVATGSKKLKELLISPFNLNLLAELLSNGVSNTELAVMNTRGQLLERYWGERLAENLIVGESALSKLVDVMLSQRSTVVHINSLEHSVVQTLTSLALSGLIIYNKDTRRLSFRHHVIFDFAVAQLGMAADTSKAETMFNKADGAGLLLAPAFMFWVERLYRESNSENFTAMIVKIISDKTLDPIIRSEASRLFISMAKETPYFDALISYFSPPMDEKTMKVFEELIGAFLSKKSQSGEDVSNWARFAALIKSPNRRVCYPLRMLVQILIEQQPKGQALIDLGAAARELFTRCLEDEDLAQSLSTSIIPLVAATFATDSMESEKLLRGILEENRFSRIGFIEVPALAQNVEKVVPNRPELARDIYQLVFSSEGFTSDQTTQLGGGGYILSLTSNAAQDFNSAKHSLSEAFPKILFLDANLAVLALAAAINGERKKHKYSEDRVKHVIVDGQNYVLDQDYSYIWAGRVERESHDDYAKIYASFLDWAKRSKPADVLTAVQSLLANSSAGLAWRCAFTLGAMFPEVVGKAFWKFATNELFLKSSDTRETAIGLIKETQIFVDALMRETFERDALNFSFEAFNDPDEARRHSLSAIFHNIGEENILLEESRQIIHEYRQKHEAETGGNLDFLSVDNDDFYEVFDTHPQQTERPELDNLSDKVLLAINDNSQVSEDTIPSVVNLHNKISQLLANKVEQDPEIILKAEAALGNSICFLLTKANLPEEENNSMLEVLLDLSQHPYPIGNAEVERKFSENRSWSHSTPRITAAKSLGDLMRSPELWSTISARVKHLILHDGHPAVRSVLVERLGYLYRTSEAEMWELIDSVFDQERNLGVLHSLFNVLYSLASANPNKIESLYLNLFEKLKPERKDEQRIALLVYFGIEKELPRSVAEIEKIIDEIFQNHAAVTKLLFQARYLLSIGYDDVKPDDTSRKNRTRGYIEKILSIAGDYIETWTARDSPSDPMIVSAVRVIDSLADQLCFSVGGVGQVELTLETEDGKNLFLSENYNLILKLANLGTPRATHHLLETIEKFISTDPEQSFDLIHKILIEQGRIAGYQLEMLGSKQIVKIISLYLADYRYVFEDPGRRSKLIECLSLFVDAGWQEARNLFNQLPELLS